MRVVTPHEMNSIDALMAQKYNIPTNILMENAGNAVATYLSQSYGKNTKLLFIAGSGNNGGDGWVAARLMLAKGYDITVISLSPEEKMREATSANYRIARNLGIKILIAPDMTELAIEIAKTDVIIDAILGTGISGTVKDDVKAVIELINHSGKDIISIDVPSGVDAETGKICGACVNADCLIVLGTLKQGLLFAPAKYTAKKVIVDSISIPEFVYCEAASPKFVYSSADIAKLLKPRIPHAHKGVYGKLGIIAGSVGMTGAACLSADAALKSGAGIIKLAVPQRLNSIFELKLTEQMTVPMPDNNFGALISSKELIDFTDGMSALVIGPGLGKNSHAAEFIPQILAIYDLPIVIDADGLNSITTNPNVLTRGNCVITPHIGEMARLTYKSITEVEQNQVEVAAEFALKYNVVVVLKSYITVIASPDGRIVFNTTGNNGMATGGSGDVLSGIIGSLLAEGYDGFTAATLGTFINGLAGDIAAEKTGETALTPTDTVNAIASAFNTLRSL